MRLYIVKKLSLFCLLGLSSAAFAGTDHSIENCAKLLPSDGKQYELSLNGIIAKDNKFEGEMTITDSTKKELSDEEKTKIQPFIECVKNVIK